MTIMTEKIFDIFRFQLFLNHLARMGQVVRFQVVCNHSVYLVYPQLGSEIESFLQKNKLLLSDPGISSILQSVTAKLQNTENQSDTILQSAIAKLEEWSTPADWLFYKLNYTTLAYLTNLVSHSTKKVSWPNISPPFLFRMGHSPYMTWFPAPWRPPWWLLLSPSTAHPKIAYSS